MKDIAILVEGEFREKEISLEVKDEKETLRILHLPYMPAGIWMVPVFVVWYF